MKQLLSTTGIRHWLNERMVYTIISYFSVHTLYSKINSSREGILWHRLDKSLLIHANLSPGGFLKKTRLNSTLVLKMHAKNPRNKKIRVYSWIAFCRKKIRVENQIKTRFWEDSNLCPETTARKSVQEIHLWFFYFPNTFLHMYMQSLVQKKLSLCLFSTTFIWKIASLSLFSISQYFKQCTSYF